MLLPFDVGPSRKAMALLRHAAQRPHQTRQCQESNIYAAIRQKLLRGKVTRAIKLTARSLGVDGDQPQRKETTYQTH